jgi:hypothetical protein
MKKSFFTIVFLLAVMLPAFSQPAERMPLEDITLNKGNLPPSVLKAADEIFKGNTQIQWGVFPYELEDYGWVVNPNYTQPIDHYSIRMKTNDGSNLYAVFESTGELIRYKLTSKDMTLPVVIKNAIAKTEYKDWKVTGLDMVRNNQKKVEEHYIVKLEKGGQKKSLYYSLKGEVLTNKR